MRALSRHRTLSSRHHGKFFQATPEITRRVEVRMGFKDTVSSSSSSFLGFKRTQVISPLTQSQHLARKMRQIAGHCCFLTIIFVRTVCRVRTIPEKKEKGSAKGILFKVETLNFKRKRIENDDDVLSRHHQVCCADASRDMTPIHLSWNLFSTRFRKR